MRRIILFVVCFIFMINIAIAVPAIGEKDSKHREKVEKYLIKMIQIMTPEQKEEFKKIKLEHDRNLIAIEAEVKNIQLDLKTLIISDIPDENLIYKKIDELALAKSKIEKEKVKLRIKTRKMLSPEQIDQLKEKRKHKK